MQALVRFMREAGLSLAETFAGVAWCDDGALVVDAAMAGGASVCAALAAFSAWAEGPKAGVGAVREIYAHVASGRDLAELPNDNGFIPGFWGMNGMVDARATDLRNLADQGAIKHDAAQAILRAAETLNASPSPALVVAVVSLSMGLSSSEAELGFLQVRALSHANRLSGHANSGGVLSPFDGFAFEYVGMRARYEADDIELLKQSLGLVC